MITLEHQFNRLHPLTVQTDDTFFDEFIRFSNEVDACILAEERLLLTVMTTKCPNKDLRTELLKNPTTMADTAAGAKVYAAAQKTEE